MLCLAATAHTPPEVPQTFHNHPDQKARAEGNDSVEASGTNPDPRVSDVIAAHSL